MCAARTFLNSSFLSSSSCSPYPFLRLSGCVYINANQTYKPLSSGWGRDQTLQKGKTDQRCQQSCFSQAKPYTLLNLLKLVFFVGILKTSGKCLMLTKR